VEILVTTESTNRRGKLQRAQRRMAAGELTIGRSTRAQIHLPDPRVALEHARIAVTDAAATINAHGGLVHLNGREISSAQLTPGDRVRIGPYFIRVDSPSAGAALALSIEPITAVHSGEAPLQRLLLQTRAASKRRLSYLLAFAVLALFLALPLAWDALNAFGPHAGLEAEQLNSSELVADLSNRALQWWNPGQVSRSHQSFQSNCRGCHQVQDHNPFVSQLPVASQVLDQACLNCHRDLSEHVPRTTLNATMAGRAFAQARCASCHRDHKDQRMAPRMDALCTNCHRDIRRIAPQAAAQNVSDFLGDHPNFRLSPIVADTGEIQRGLPGPAFRERSNLKFNHKLHLDPRGVRSPRGRIAMKCGDCHEPADNGRRMAPISMQSHCSTCHSLKFDCSRERSADPLRCRSGARAVPHGSVADVAASLREFYARYALGDAPPDATPPPDLPRLRPGAKLAYEDRQPVLTIADQNARRVLNELFTNLNVCGTCHFVRRTDEAPGWSVAPIRLTQVWMPAAQFTHARHTTVACATCHKAGRSSDAHDIVMPDLQDCRTCHAGSRPVFGKITSDCATCHKFHAGKHLWAPMPQAAAKARSVPW
jgi:predicted CXXCH cytochrome family protein